MPENNSRSKSVLAAVDNYIAIDIGATGQDPAGDSIILLNAVRVVKGRSIGKFKTIIDPERSVPAQVLKSAGVTPSLLFGAPKLAEMLPVFLGFIGGETVVCHRAGELLPLLDRDCRKYVGRPFGNNYIDTAELAELVFPEDDNTSLESLSKAFFADNGVINKRIDTRADVAAKCYEYMKLYCGKYGVELDPSPEKTEALILPAILLPDSETEREEPPAEPERTAPNAEAAAETAKPEAANEPEKQPEAAAEPEKQPEAAAEPEKQPEAAAEPEKQPGAAAEPEKQPEAASEPEKQPEAAAEPEKQPGTANEPKKQPEASTAKADRANEPAPQRTAEKAAGSRENDGTFDEKLVRVLRSEDLKQNGNNGAARTRLRVLLVILTIASVAGMIAYAFIRKPWMLLVMIALIAAYVACCIAVTLNGKKKKE